ncbi:MAG: 23S rRNA (guanosine(2251)-2'-O)-methyltransferase RlmB [Pyrinomonadaceae bacterium]
MKKKFQVPGSGFPVENQRPKTKDPKPKTPTAFIYGVSPVLEALRAENRRIDKVLIADGGKEHRLSEIVDLCRARSIAWSHVPRATIARYLDSKMSHQGVIAFTASADYVSIDEILKNAGETPLIVVLDGVEDPRNFGAILRVAECSAVDGVIIPERRAVGLTDTVAKSSAGAIEYVKVAKTANLNRLIEKLKEQNIWVVGTSMDAEMSYTDWDWTRPSALVLGREGGGLHRLVAENCDVLVKIPMYGKIDSLNVSVAAGVILFEARRQRAVSGKR